MPFWNGKPSVMNHMAAVWLRRVDIASLPAFLVKHPLRRPRCHRTPDGLLRLEHGRLFCTDLRRSAVKSGASIRGPREIVNLPLFLCSFPFAIPDIFSIPPKSRKVAEARILPSVTDLGRGQSINQFFESDDEVVGNKHLRMIESPREVVTLERCLK
ncbi:hypothetical protein AVEN_257572-1 [Araneus ventricosus]|uniref:Uncharacterized protein n=1 Tax=Araneus ventricosus TaxID=182803 RepID=A0A4Y2SKR2_ARAVE|nr:hypothetical protein AVEN_257572-1 [Araneus ventricosus]